MVSVAVGDAFAQLFDALAKVRAGAQTLEDWHQSAGFAAGRAAVRSKIRNVGGRPCLDSSVMSGTDPEYSYGVLTAVDMLLTKAADTRFLTGDWVIVALRLLYQRHGRFNETVGGMVVPRRVHRGRDHQRDDTFDQGLNTLRIRESSAAGCVWVRVDPVMDHRPGLATLQIGQVPIAAAADLRRREVVSSGAMPAYEMRPDPGLQARVPAAVAALAGVDLGITAEATVDDAILDAWRAALVGPDGPTWVLVGTGPVEVAPDTPGVSAPVRTEPFKDGSEVPVNRAVIVHGRTGRLIAVADKMRGYCIAAGDLETYGLLKGSESRVEGIRDGTKVVIVESHAGRFSVQVCEDLDRLTEIGPMLKELGVSHILNPVVAPELLAWRWQHKAGNALFKDAGARLITGNSLAIQRFKRGSDEGVPTLLVVDDPTKGKDFQLVANPAAGAQSDEEDAVTVRSGSVSTAPLP